MYKKIIQALVDANTKEQYYEVCAMIDKAFEAEKISWSDHEQLYALVSKFNFD